MREQFLSLLNARFRRNGRNANQSYVRYVMIFVFEIDIRIARLCMRAGRLHKGV